MNAKCKSNRFLSRVIPFIPFSLGLAISLACSATPHSSPEDGDKTNEPNSKEKLASLRAEKGPRPLVGKPLAPGQTSSPITGGAPDKELTARMITETPITKSDDRCLSPYFHIQGGDPSLDQLPLKQTSADVSIAGVIADVTVTQVYANSGKRPIEAIYVFPASTRAAVYAMKMTIGERVIEAQIREREKARQEYEQAKAEGKSASLLEQERPNVFQMNVANILPGDEIVVEMRYTELLVPQEGIYEFIYPTVVGPRYSTTPAAGASDTEKWVENPYLKEGEAPTMSFDVTASLEAGMAIQEIAVPTHKVGVQYTGEDSATLALDQSEAGGANRDFILRYRLAGQAVQSGLLLYEGKDENFFLLMNQPPARVSAEAIVSREYVFVVDVSGSMNGFPLEVSKTLLRNLIGSLKSHERFNVILFAGASSVMSPESLTATSANIDRAIQVIDQQRGGGGTNLLPALERALTLPTMKGYSRNVVVVTDGYVSVEPQAFDLIRTRQDEANVFAFGIGSSVNRHLIEGMARVGQGEPFVVLNASEAPAQAEKFRTYIEAPVLTDVSINFQGFDAYDIEPQSYPDVLAQRPVIVFGKYRGDAKGTITIEGLSGQNAYSKAFDVGKSEPEAKNAALRYLWARDRIAILGDYNNLTGNTDARVKEITDLGLNYHLLTAYTSFVAVDSLVRTDGSQSVTVKQPLPLPDGVSNMAVGGPLMAKSAPASLGYGGGGVVGGVVGGLGVAPMRAPAVSPEVSARATVRPSGSVAADTSTASATSEAAERKKDKADDAARVIRVTQVKATGSITEGEARAVLNKINAALQVCSARGHAGSLTLELSFDAEGKVTSVTVVKRDSSLNEQSLIDCLVVQLKRQVFSTADANSRVTVTFSLER